jgi:hypothetical protein
MNEPIAYIHLPPEGNLPSLAIPRPFRAVLVLESEVGAIWQGVVSSWLIEFGCLYAVSVGKACSTWDDSIDWANLEKFDFHEIPPACSVMTTWHENQTLSEVFWFAKHSADHPTEHLKATVILHIAAAPREAELLQAYAAA